MPNFALVGAAGFVAPRHIRAIEAVGGRLVAALDLPGTIGPAAGLPAEARPFDDPARFEAELARLAAGPAAGRVDFVSICTPNDTHGEFVRLALRAGATAICEKPLGVVPADLDALRAAEERFGRRVFTVLQLRHHPAVAALRAAPPAPPTGGKHRVELAFLTRRPPGYFSGWKGDEARSGGLAVNLGIHYFDLLLWLFGRAEAVAVARREPAALAGTLELERARVRWTLSADGRDIPPAPDGSPGPIHRSLTIDGREVDFSTGLDDLHAAAYREILAGRGPGVEEARPSVELADRIRRAPVQGG